MRRPASAAAWANAGILGEADAVGRGLHAEVADLAGVGDRVEEERRDRRLAARELHRHLAPRLDRERVVEDLLDLVERELVDVADLVGVHEARIAHHVAAVRQVDGEDRAAAVLDGRGAVVVQAIGDRLEVAAREQRLRCASRNAGIDGEHVGEGAVLGQVFSMTICPSRSTMCALISPACPVDERLDDPARRRECVAASP